MKVVWILRAVFIALAAAAGWAAWNWAGGGIGLMAAAGLTAWEHFWLRRPGCGYKILDTSVIIDGRITDICKTGFLEGVLVIPRFVLVELQRIADSADALRRNRGRRGLDTLANLQRIPGVTIEIWATDFSQLTAVDEKLILMAKKIRGRLLTQDMNLNKIASLQGIRVMNVNELANAVKTVMLPGEDLSVRVVKEGKEPGQGVGYLDDGTMVVVENGRNYMNQRLMVSVTSVLQTTAGRMVFAKMKNGDTV